VHLTETTNPSPADIWNLEFAKHPSVSSGPSDIDAMGVFKRITCRNVEVINNTRQNREGGRVLRSAAAELRCRGVLRSASHTLAEAQGLQP
jgi:hypothetical protein